MIIRSFRKYYNCPGLSEHEELQMRIGYSVFLIVVDGGYLHLLI